MGTQFANLHRSFNFNLPPDESIDHIIISLSLFLTALATKGIGPLGPLPLPIAVTPADFPPRSHLEFLPFRPRILAPLQRIPPLDGMQHIPFLRRHRASRIAQLVPLARAGMLPRCRARRFQQ